MGYWETSERNNFAAKSLDLLDLRRNQVVEDLDLDCTLLLAALTMLLCNTLDSVKAARRNDRVSFGAGSISVAPRDTYNRALTDVLSKSTQKQIRATGWKRQELPPRPSELASEVKGVSADLKVGGLIGAIRNAVAHGSVEWTKDGSNRITGALFMAREHDNPQKPQRWRAFRLELPAIEFVTRWWANAFMESPAPPSEHASAIESEFLESARAA
jgi:hypothetical protein